MKKPKYKIGDVIVYQDLYFDKEKDSMLHVYQSRIIESYGLLETDDKEDELTWYYYTEHSDKEQWDSIEEDNIMYKLD
jgi:hypothetical protein